MSDGECLFLEKRLGELREERPLRQLKAHLLGVLGELLKREWLARFSDSVRKRMCVDGVHVLHEDIRVVSLKFGFISGGFRSCTD